MQETPARLPERQQLALKAMFARDVYHIAMLYDTFLRSSKLAEESTGRSNPVPEELDESDQPRAVLGFRSSLFD